MNHEYRITHIIVFLSKMPPRSQNDLEAATPREESERLPPFFAKAFSPNRRRCGENSISPNSATKQAHAGEPDSVSCIFRCRDPNVVPRLEWMIYYLLLLTVRAYSFDLSSSSFLTCSISSCATRFVPSTLTTPTTIPAPALFTTT